MKKRILMMIAALFVGLSAGWLLPAQQAPAPSGPQWKDTKEWEEAQEFSKGKTDAEKVAALDKWSKDYPNTEVWQSREEAYFGVYANMKDYRKLFERAKAIRAKEPNYFYAINYILKVVPFLTPPGQPADLATAEETARYVLNNEAKIFDPANKPINMDAAQWPTLKAPTLKEAQQAIAWVAFTRKDYPKAEVELTKVIKDDNTQAQYSYWLGSSLMAERATEPQKIPAGIFHIVRAGSYEGQNAMPAATRTQIMASATNIYKSYHGDTTGLDKVIELAKNSAFPPADFKIESVNDIAMAKYANQQAFDDAHPDIAFWRDTIKTPLTGPDADMVFNERYKDAGLPPPGGKFDKFKIKIISLNPETSPKEIVAGLADANVADVKLVFDDPLPGTMMPGEELQFKGAVKAYQKEPFMVTFDVDPKDLTGWTGTGPVKKSPPKSPAKGTGKGTTKGKGK